MQQTNSVKSQARCLQYHRHNRNQYGCFRKWCK